MATTRSFQVIPDFFKTKEECLQSNQERKNTNPRYRRFRQIHFTAGDIDQFEKYRDATNGQICIPNIDMKDNKFSNVSFRFWEKNRNINAEAVRNTFLYLFNKFKKGIFVKIKNNELQVFLPFSKNNFVNEWSDQIRINPKYKNLEGFINYVSKLGGRKANMKYVNKFIETWYSNNCLVRYEFPIQEGDTNHPNISDLLLTLCKERRLPDIEFFINRRDFPLMTEDGTEPYKDMFGGDVPLLSHSYHEYSPILSMVTRKGYADIPMPTGEDWARICSKEGKYFPRSCKEYTEDFKGTPWKDKKPIAVFRGGSTGCGVAIQTNPRLKLAYLSSQKPIDKDDNQPYLDAGITNWNIRPRKSKGSKYLETIDIKSLPFGLVNRLTPQQQTEYKYIINVDGHVSAFRLSLEMGMGCCILLANSPYEMWFHRFIQPYKHYVPVRADLSDLLTQIKWCKNNDEKCEEIAQNALKFYNQYLSKDGVLDYMQKLLLDLKKFIGVYYYNIKSPYQLQIDREENQLQFDYPPPVSNKVSSVPKQRKSYNLLLGINFVINMIMKKNRNELEGKRSTLFQSKTTLVEEGDIHGIPVLFKTSLTSDKAKESIHQMFASQKCINELSKYTPNFGYNFCTYRKDDKVTLISEHVVGQPFHEYITSKSFNMKDYLTILLQLSLSLHIAQQKCAFVHNDLAPWNIVIQKLDNKIPFDYPISPGIVYEVNTNIVPVIIDFGNSHVVHDNIHYGSKHMFKMSTIQDVLNLIVVSIYEVTNVAKPKDAKALVRLANFLSGTRYRQRKFVISGRNGMGDLRYFFKKAKKYNELMNQPKYELEDKTPLDFAYYLFNNFKLDIVTKYKVTNNLNVGNARQVYDYILSHDNEQRVKSYTDVFDRITSCNIPTNNNLFMRYLLQTLENELNYTYKLMTIFLTENKIDSTKPNKKYNDAIKHLRESYNREAPIQSVDIPDLQFFTKLVPAKYSESTFLEPSRIEQMLVMSPQKPISMFDYRDMIESVLNNHSDFEVDPIVLSQYISTFEDLIKTNPLNMLNNTANWHTLRLVAQEVYSLDKKYILDKMKQTPCQEAKNQLDKYNNIFDILNKDIPNLYNIDGNLLHSDAEYLVHQTNCLYSGGGLAAHLFKTFPWANVFLPQNLLSSDVQEPWFSYICNGTKTIEGRLNKGKFASFKPGEIVVWRNKNKSCMTRITKVEHFSSFREYLSKWLKEALPNVKTVEQGVAIYRKFYSLEAEKKCGILAIHLQLVPNIEYEPGTIVVRKNPDEEQYVINLMGQYNPGYQPDEIKKREKWFQEGLNEIAKLKPSSVAFPHTIGCGIARGDWKVYEGMIKKFAKQNPQTIVEIVKLN